MALSAYLQDTISWMDAALYPNFKSRWDDELFRQALLGRARPHHVVLDLGAGAGIVKETDLRGIVRRVVGLDLDRRVHENPHLDGATLGDANMIPHPSECFDLVLANNVLEHLEHPRRAFREVARVLRPGGRFLAKTPNAWHYVALIARSTPLSFHRWLNARRGVAPADTFPTYYRANTARTIRGLAAEAGLSVASIEHFEGRPEYLRFNPLTYGVGWAYERVVNRTQLLRGLRVVLIVELRRDS